MNPPARMPLAHRLLPAPSLRFGGWRSRIGAGGRLWIQER